MSDPNPFISNGTCYYEVGEESPSNMLPCGNAALGHKACCQAGDMCLDYGVCFNEKLEISYMAGCSDPKYEIDDCRTIAVGCTFPSTLAIALSCCILLRHHIDQFTKQTKNKVGKRKEDH